VLEILKFSSLNLVKIIIANEGEEFLVYFPELTDLYREMKEAYRSLITEMESNWERIEISRFKRILR
jgi:flavoprotein